MSRADASRNEAPSYKIHSNTGTAACQGDQTVNHYKEGTVAKGCPLARALARLVTKGLPSSIAGNGLDREDGLHLQFSRT